MTFNKVMQVFCLMLLLAVQLLIAQHTSVHPTETASFSVHQSVDDHGHDDHPAHNGCDLCAVLAALAHGIGPASLVVSLILATYVLSRLSFARDPVMVRVRVSSYSAQGPPASF